MNQHGSSKKNWKEVHPREINGVPSDVFLLIKISFFWLTYGNCCIIGQQTNVDWNALVSLVSNETNTDVRMYT